MSQSYLPYSQEWNTFSTCNIKYWNKRAVVQSSLRFTETCGSPAEQAQVACQCLVSHLGKTSWLVPQELYESLKSFSGKWMHVFLPRKLVVKLYNGVRIRELTRTETRRCGGLSQSGSFSNKLSSCLLAPLLESLKYHLAGVTHKGEDVAMWLILTSQLGLILYLRRNGCTHFYYVICFRSFHHSLNKSHSLTMWEIGECLDGLEGKKKQLILVEFCHFKHWKPQFYLFG